MNASRLSAFFALEVLTLEFMDNYAIHLSLTMRKELFSRDDTNNSSAADLARDHRLC